MGSILKMLADRSVRCRLSCRQLGKSVQFGRVAWAESTDIGAICVWLLRGEPVTQRKQDRRSQEKEPRKQKEVTRVKGFRKVI